MELEFSEKQNLVRRWWQEGSGFSDREAIFCDGAVRSGKTLAMGLSFFEWAMTVFQGKKLGICGKTIGSVRRNLLSQCKHSGVTGQAIAFNAEPKGRCVS